MPTGSDARRLRARAFDDGLLPALTRVLGVEHPRRSPPGDRLLLRLPDRQRPDDRERDLRSTPRSARSRSTRRPRYSQYCRVFAPMYRQVTLAGIGRRRPTTQAEPGDSRIDGVQDAFETYLRSTTTAEGSC